MKILSVLAQKPSSTGSGVYLSELVRCFKKMGHEQEIICAIYETDDIGARKTRPYAEARETRPYGEARETRSDGEAFEPHFNPVIFNTKEVPMKIAGMSDVMPYESIKYSDLAKDDEILEVWMKAFNDKIEEVVKRFKPDLIICHHLYLLTAMVVEKWARETFLYEVDGARETRPYDCDGASKNDYIPKIYGICHNTDLRQYQQTNLKREFIKDNIKKLDKIFAPSIEHKNKIVELFDVDKNKIDVIGIGYNSDIFYKDEKVRSESETTNKKTKLLYVGKVAKKKGVLSLVKAFKMIKSENVVLDIIGGAGDKDEYEEILNECKTSQHEINILKPMPQIELAKEYNSHDIFILPSFSEGIPMVPIEAMACGCKLIITDLPGVREFYNQNIKNACIKYIKLPKMSNVDDAEEAELEAFEKRLAISIEESVNENAKYEPSLGNISWENIAKNVLKA